MGSSAVYIPRYAGTVDGSGIEKKTEGLEVCENSLHDPQYYSDSSDRRYVYPSFGILKSMYGVFGLDMSKIPNLFGNSKFAFWTVTCTWIFYSAFNTIIFLAEMGAIDTSIYEAARVDGAKPWQLDRYITLPLMKNVVGTCVVLASVAMVSQFDIIYVTTKGGPGTATLNLPIYLYKTATLENNYGKANAVGVVQILVGLVLVVLIQGLFAMGKEKIKKEVK